MPKLPAETPGRGDPHDIVARRLAGHDAAHGHDTGGVPWKGRDIHDTAFAGDLGSAEPRLVDAMHIGADDAEIAEILAGSRLLVAIVAVPTEVEADETTGLVTDAASEMAAAVLTAPDGERALPVFTCIEALARWDAGARPVPVTAADAARAAIDEGCRVMVIDVASPTRRVVRSSVLWALAQERRWTHAADDPLVRAAVASAVRGEEAVHAVDLDPGERGTLLVTLALEPGLPEDDTRRITRAVADALAADDVRVRLDDVRMALRASSPPRRGGPTD